MDDNLEDVVKTGASIVGGGGITLFLARLFFAGLMERLARIESSHEKLKERIDGISSEYRPELHGLQVRVGRLEGKAGILGPEERTRP